MRYRKGLWVSKEGVCPGAPFCVGLPAVLGLPWEVTHPGVALLTHWVGQQGRPGEGIEVPEHAYFQEKT